MPQPYTGSRGELNFEEDFVDLLKTAGWEHQVLKNKTVKELIENWRAIIFERNRATLNDIPLSDEEMGRIMDEVKLNANTPVKANHFITGRQLAINRDLNSPDTQHAGKEVYLDLFSAAEIAGGSSRYQIAEQTYFENGSQYNDRRGDVTLLINGMPVIHIELKASGVDVSEAYNQITKYAQEGAWKGFMGLLQVFWAITPEDAMFFANAGDKDSFNTAFAFRWGDKDNNVVKDWRELITGKSHILSIPEAHKLIGYYTVADTAKDILKVCRSYQHIAIREIVARTAKQCWGDHDQLGGFVWCTTGGGKTMTSFKAGQLIADMHLADKVVFVVDRKVLDEQSAAEYNSFQRDGETISATASSKDLFNKLKSSSAKDSLILTSIQKISRIDGDMSKLRQAELKQIQDKRIVFIIDEAHRSQFGVMHQRVKSTFPNAVFFGFTGTPIFVDNKKDGELTTETVFGRCLSVYSLASGIRDGNVLGFWPEAVKTYSDEDLKETVALVECHIKSVNGVPISKEAWKIYRQFIANTSMATRVNELGQIEKGIEDYLPSGQYNCQAHREEVVKNIISRFKTISCGELGTLFHGILATESIPEAYEYWKLFKQQAPHLHVTALFDPNIYGNGNSVFVKEKALSEIIDDYNATFGTSYNRRNDPQYSMFKSDLTNRLAHKNAYKHIGNDHSKIIDIVIVVDQLLTGFDSQWINVLYLDKVMDTNNLIQAISRTNRVFNQVEKPWGMVKFYRKPYTMQQNLQEALKLYCQGDFAGVEVGDMPKNIKDMGTIFSTIQSIFAHDNIKNFQCLPKKDEDRQKFRKEFGSMKSLMRAVKLQGFTWDSKGKDLPFDKNTYEILCMRYDDLPSNRVGNNTSAKPGYSLNTDMSTMEMEKIDASYLESQFKIVTMHDLEKNFEDEERKNAIREIENNLGYLTELQQRYAKKVIEDIKGNTLKVKKGKKFSQYIKEYQEETIHKSIHEYSSQFGLDESKMYDLYVSAGKDGIDSLKMENFESTVDVDLLKANYAVSEFKARIKFHKEIEEYILSRKADLAKVDL